MKNFSELLDTDFHIDIAIQVRPKHAASAVKIVINDQIIIDQVIQQVILLEYSVPLLAPIKVLVFHDNAYVESLKFDGWESRPEYGTEGPGLWSFETHKPFYPWHHHATGLGWLLTPN
jgi:hypothetical protein